MPWAAAREIHARFRARFERGERWGVETWRWLEVILFEKPGRKFKNLQEDGRAVYIEVLKMMAEEEDEARSSDAKNSRLTSILGGGRRASVLPGQGGMARRPSAMPGLEGGGRVAGSARARRLADSVSKRTLTQELCVFFIFCFIL